MNTDFVNITTENLTDEHLCRILNKKKKVESKELTI